MWCFVRGADRALVNRYVCESCPIIACICHIRMWSFHLCLCRLFHLVGLVVNDGCLEVFFIPLFHTSGHFFGYLITTHTAGPDWSSNPNELGKDKNFGSQVDRHNKKGSPVVPGSLKKVMEDNDSALYTVVVLRSMYEVSCYMLLREKNLGCYILENSQHNLAGWILRRPRICYRHKN